MSVHDRDKTGKTRIRCSAVRESGSCSNRRIIYLRDVERLVLSGMVEELKDPRLIETYVRNYNSERERLAGNASAERLRLEAKRDRIEGERQRNIDLVIKYVISEEDAKQRIAELKQERLRVEAELAALEEAPTPISLHPATLDRYIETVNALADTIATQARRTTGARWSPTSGRLCTVSSSTRKALGKASRSRSRESWPHWSAERSFRRPTTIVGDRW
ncbi:hypothetical protein [Bradyrhizobium uaiense]|nr:hypothetical protein [Bradyrhizobium uaiense]